MYGLAEEREGCRFSVTLGLRTLPLQTGDAYRDLLKLGDDKLAVLTMVILLLNCVLMSYRNRASYIIY